MKVAAVLALFCSAGCAHRIAMNAQQQCANEGMVLDGVDLGSGSSSAVDSDGNTYRGSTSYHGVHCGVAKTSEDKCKVGVYSQSLAPERDYNESVALDNLLIGVGYCLYVLPGVAVYYHYDSEKQKAIDESNSIIGNGVGTCEHPAGGDVAH